MTTTEPPAEPGRELLEDLQDLEGPDEVRLRLELLHHLVVVGHERGDPAPPLLGSTAVRFATPGAARILSRLLEREDPRRRAQQARRWLMEAAEADEATKATVIAVVAPHLDEQEAAYIVAMGLTSEHLWVAALLALGRVAEARAAASGELLARVRVMTSDVRASKPAGSPDDPWWRSVAIAGPAGAQRRGDGIDDAERDAAVAALVAIGDGAWHLLATRHNPVLRSVIDDADSLGGAYLAAARQRTSPARAERHRVLLSGLDPAQRTTLAHGLSDALLDVARIGTPPPPRAARPTSPPEPALEAAAPTRSARRWRGIGPSRQRSEPAPQRTGPEPDAGPPPQRQSAAPSPGSSLQDRKPGIVSTGFAPVDDRSAAFDPGRPLPRGRSCLFWLEVGPEPLPGSIELEHVALPADLPRRARLTVALFAYDGELQLRQGATRGVLELADAGTAIVVEQPDGTPSSGGERRLRFPVVTPEAAGTARLRCSIYHRGVLVQSRVVTARVGDESSSGAGEPRALRSVVDYRLLHALDPARLESLSEHRASLLLNDDGAGTHALRFAAVDGSDVLTRDVSIGEGAIADQIRMARHALRRVSWGSEQEFSESQVYRYGGAVDETRLTADLVTLAANGARFFQLLTEEVAATDPDGTGDADPYLARDRIAEVLRRPGRVQIALQRAPNHILPAALVYDHWFTDSAPSGAYRLCADFVAARRSGVALERSSCFRGDCPQAQPGADLAVVCPSGFWGFRHELGFPVTHGDGVDVTELIAVKGTPAVSVAVSTELTSHAAHVEGLRGFVPDRERWRLADTRDEFLVGLRSDDQQIVYVYCHGGVANNVPYLRLGEPGARPITRLDLANERVRWASSRPLVILNGCHTTALDPETAIDFVRFFVRTALASGVVGTEITVFEELGQAFGQALVKRFLAPGTTLGAAIRGARLDLLAVGNPLGLVYIPFAMAGLRLDDH